MATQPSDSLLRPAVGLRSRDVAAHVGRNIAVGIQGWTVLSLAP
ncbi:MAG: hypothetical protein JWQ56_470 [Pseudarthrobacter sp.]|nr:hypothetical protein [Pseudarthrobacter sp.]